MFKHWLGIVGGAIVVGALLFGGLAVTQAAMGGGFGSGGPWYHAGPMMGWSATPGSYGMMGPNGGRMGPNMMGGYGSAQSPANATPVAGNSVTIQNFTFQPANLQVKVGTTVTWTNQDTAPHTVTFRDSSLTSSGTLQKGGVYTYTFTKVDTFAYYCQFHPYMIAQVVVTA